MGYEMGHGNVDDEFLCSICGMVLEDPMQSPCEHTFCNHCIRSWIKVQAICPLDRCVLPERDLKPTPWYFRNVLNRVEVKCKFGKLHSTYVLLRQ